MKLTPADIRYEWCWHCKHATAMCNFCNGNACACGCHNLDHSIPQEQKPCRLNGFWEAEKLAQQQGLEPTLPTPTEILEYLASRAKYCVKIDTPESDILDWTIFSDEDYWYIKKYADLQNIVIPDYVDFCSAHNLLTKFECQSGAQFMLETPEIQILDYSSAWPSQDSFDTELIPWREYCLRRDRSKCEKK